MGTMIGRLHPYGEGWREGRLRVATYNIHRCRGMDGQTKPERIAEVLRSTNADVIALQEVIGAGHGHGGQAEAIGAALGMGWVMASTRLHRGYLFGNVILSRFPITHHTQYDLSWRQCESRNCQRADLRIGERELYVFNVHLGTALLERRYQAERLASYLRHQKLAGPKIVLGDFNEWLKGQTTRLLSDTMKSVDLRMFLKRRRTYPGMFPVLHLDHIYYDGALDVVGVELARTRLSLVASDHLPLVAEIQFT
jgi:endonuclease/exonuclease/phosphatase family metal-dependent hydrolase